MAVGPGAATAGGVLSVQSLTRGGSMTCAWGFALPAGGHWVDDGSGVQGETGHCVPRDAGEGLTLDAEAELLLLVGDVAGDSPDESHGQATGDPSDCPRLCHCGAQRELCEWQTHTHTPTPTPPVSPSMPHPPPL